MKTICAVLLAVILSFELNAQTNFYNQSQFNFKPLKLKDVSGKFKETAQHVGIEYGPIFDPSEKPSFKGYIHTLWGSYEISIGEKKLFFRFEAGAISDGEFKSGAGVAAFGLNYRIIKSGRHIVYLFFGLEGWVSGPFGGFFGIVNPKYVFMLNNNFGISAGLRYMSLISLSPFELDSGFLCPSAGVQFFL